MLGRVVSSTKVGSLVAQAVRTQAPWLEFDQQEFRAAYNQRPFTVRHRVTEHPLFERGAVAALCRRLPAEQVRWRFGVVPADIDFNTSLHDRGDLTLDDALERMEEKQAYVMVFNPERDPVYGPVIEGFLGEIAAHTERIDPGMNWYSTYIFMSAHDSVTPYHMDREMNFLLQIRGTKTVQLWDPRDDEIMSPAEKDRLLADHDEPRPRYKPSFERKALTYELVPGIGVHHPFIAPHVVKTGKQLSISLAITFRTQRSDTWTDAHRFNHLLRRRTGMALGTVGQLDLVDATKARLMQLSRQARRILRQSHQPPSRHAP